MSQQQVRVRFAPSPTGGLHLGGMRTVLYNYLFARKYQGRFIVRIEDTDQNRLVEGAEAYIFQCLDWCGLTPDESPLHGGAFGPYRQSERKAMYRQYAEQLVKEGHAYYAFDTPEELDAMRTRYKTAACPNPQYDHTVRMGMRNSLCIGMEETQQLLAAGTPHVIRIKMPERETITLQDMIRGDVQFDTSVVDDKVLLKADGMPTYHLAVVVDDHLMQITHAFRGEEWLPSAPVHVLLWKYLFGLDKMPVWAHLPLILGPNGKLSKRDGARYGFPVFAMQWTDPRSGEFTEGFREKGFLPAAFINLLALLGWNDGTDREIFTLPELTEHFTMERVHSSGAKFDYEKAKWFNHEWIKRTPATTLIDVVHPLLQAHHIPVLYNTHLIAVIELVKDRCALLPDFIQQAGYFYQLADNPDLDAIQQQWTTEKRDFFMAFADTLAAAPAWDSASLELLFKETASAMHRKPGELQLPLRIMLVGGKFGPPVFAIAALLGREETVRRIRQMLSQL